MRGSTTGETEKLLELSNDPDHLQLAASKSTLRDFAHRWLALDEEVKALVEHVAPDLVELFGVGVELAGQFLVTAGDNHERIKNEAVFAKVCGVAPQPATSGRTTGRHQLSRSGDCATNSSLYIVVSPACDTTYEPRPTSLGAPSKG